MANSRTIELDWKTGAIQCESGAYLARQWDHLSNLVILRNAPAVGNFYLVVEMKEDVDDLKPHEMSPVALSGPQWLVPSLYTQLVQPVTFQFVCVAESGDFVQSSAKFAMNIVPTMSGIEAIVEQ